MGVEHERPPPADDPPVAAVRPAGGGARRREVVATCELVALALVLVGLLVGAVEAVAEGWIPVSDEALIELQVRDVPSAMPLVGVYSRFGWNHPGPAEFLLLSIPYRLGGSSSPALLVGMLLLHGAAVAGAWRLARSVSRTSGTLVLTAMAAVAVGVPATMLRSPWNPNVPVLLSGLLVVATWAAVEGRRAGLVAVPVVASVLVQVHVGTTPLAATSVAIVGVAAVTGRIWRCPRRLRSAGAGVALALLLWAPPLAEELGAGQGNLSAILDHLDAGEDVLGLAPALDVAARGYALVPDWVRPDTAATSLPEPGRPVPVWSCLPVAGLLLAARRRAWPCVRGLAVALLAQASMVLAIARIEGGLFTYLFHGNRVVAAICIALGGAACVDHGPRRIGDLLRGAALTATAVLAVVLGLRQAAADNPADGLGAAAAELAVAIADAGDGAPIELAASTDFTSIEVAYGVMLYLERTGAVVRMPGEDASRVGDRRDDRLPGATSIEIVPIDRLRDAAPGDVLAVHQPFSAAELAAIERLTTQRRLQAMDGTLSERERYEAVRSIDERIDRVRRGRAAVAAVRAPP